MYSVERLSAVKQACSLEMILSACALSLEPLQKRGWCCITCLSPPVINYLQFKCGSYAVVLCCLF